MIVIIEWDIYYIWLFNLCSCIFDRNVALSGSAIRVASYSRVDIASLPIEINNW